MTLHRELGSETVIPCGDLVTLGWQRELRPLVHVRCPTSRVGLVRSVLGGRYDSPDPPGVEVRRVLDIGAGVGEFALYAAARWEGCWVDAWEPDAELLALLAENGPAGMRMLDAVPDNRSVYQVIRYAMPGLSDGDTYSHRGTLSIVDYQTREAGP